MASVRTIDHQVYAFYDALFWCFWD